MTIWLNGKLLESGAIAASSAGVTVGWGVFTTVGVRGGQPLFLARHIQRLQRDATEAEIKFPFSPEQISAAACQLLAANDIGEGLLRLTLTRQGDGRWNKSQGADLSLQTLPAPTVTSLPRVQLSKYRIEARRPLVGVKTTSYLPYIWAWREAKSRGFDETILRDGDDNLSEGARSNLFWVAKNQIFTPCLETGCLRGLGRELMLEWAHSRGIEVHEGKFSVGDVVQSEAAYLISGATGPRLIASWHDENEESLRQWQSDSDLAIELRAWWDQAGTI
ncbi:hypothetical protein EON80_10355 [bacterium]|nr:MAG: hypothetical protein EON80_10355 [bacterium]